MEPPTWVRYELPFDRHNFYCRDSYVPGRHMPQDKRMLTFVTFAGNRRPCQSLTGKSQLLSMAKALSRLIPNADCRLISIRHGPDRPAATSAFRRLHKPTSTERISKIAPPPISGARLSEAFLRDRTKSEIIGFPILQVRPSNKVISTSIPSCASVRRLLGSA